MHKSTSPPLVATIGNFDGVHQGHQRIIARVTEKARDCNGIPAALIFYPLPRVVLQPQQRCLQLMSFSEKCRTLKALGIEQIMALRFNAILMRLSPQVFVTEVLHQQLGLQQVIVGEDFRFGFQQQGDFALLKKCAEPLGITCESISVNGPDKISSTGIREALLRGDLKTVTHCLGRPFTLTGRVMYGQQLGRTLGYPTANIALHRHQQALQGIFIVRVLWKDQWYPGVASVGTRPTIQDQKKTPKTLLEVHIFDFSHTLYGERITVELIAKIRDEAQFDSIALLRQHIEQDVAKGRAHFEAVIARR
jgi:riboflavin kinase/FMN adenylyltransferase